MGSRLRCIWLHNLHGRPSPATHLQSVINWERHSKNKTHGPCARWARLCLQPSLSLAGSNSGGVNFGAFQARAHHTLSENCRWAWALFIHCPARERIYSPCCASAQRDEFWLRCLYVFAFVSLFIWPCARCVRAMMLITFVIISRPSAACAINYLFMLYTSLCVACGGWYVLMSASCCTRNYFHTTHKL